MTPGEEAAYVREVASQKTAALRMSLDAVERQGMPFRGETGGVGAGQGMGEVPTAERGDDVPRPGRRPGPAGRWATPARTARAGHAPRSLRRLPGAPSRSTRTSRRRLGRRPAAPPRDHADHGDGDAPARRAAPQRCALHARRLQR